MSGSQVAVVKRPQPGPGVHADHERLHPPPVTARSLPQPQHVIRLGQRGRHNRTRIAGQDLGRQRPGEALMAVQQAGVDTPCAVTEQPLHDLMGHEGRNEPAEDDLERLAAVRVASVPLER
ncbi:MAG: hypothetical protein ACRD0K_07450 [Egibacteraceae bacterium]